MIDFDQLADHTNSDGDERIPKGYCIECKGPIYNGEPAFNTSLGLLHGFISTCEFEKELALEKTAVQPSLDVIETGTDVDSVLALLEADMLNDLSDGMEALL